MLPPPTDDKLKSLAQAVAAGRSVKSWAKRHHTEVEVADAWCSLPEFDGLVDAHRLGVANRMSGALLARASAAIDQIFTTLRRSPAYPVKLSAGRMLMDNWLRVSLRFEQSKKMAELKARLVALEQKANASGSR